MQAKIFQFLTGLIVISSLSVLALAIPALAQSKTNANLLTIVKVNQIKDGKVAAVEATRSDPTGAPNQYVTSAKVTPDDDIRYSWKNFVIDLKNVGAKNKASSGYIKVYLGKEAKGENYIINAGQNLPVKDIKSKLIPGENTILLQLVANDGKPVVPSTEVTLTFQYTSDSLASTIEVLSPKAGSVVSSRAVQTFKLDTKNFTLENNATLKQNSGRLTVYYDEVKDDRLIDTIYKNEFRSDEFAFDKIPDGPARKLIFVLRDNKNNLLKPSVETTLEIKANFQNSIDIGMPKISILLPNKADPNISLNEDDKIVVRVENFELVDNSKTKQIEAGRGVLQISLDNQKVADSLTKTEFSLGELNLGDTEKGQKVLKVELVAKDFSQFSPEVSDTLRFTYSPTVSNDSSTEVVNAQETQNPAWKVIIVILIVILIIGGIAVLITKA